MRKLTYVLTIMITLWKYNYAQLPSQDSCYTLIWGDEFNSGSLDASKWETNVPWGNDWYKLDCGNPPDTVKYPEYRTPGNNFQFTGSSVKLKAKRENYSGSYIKGWYKYYDFNCQTCWDPVGHCLNDTCNQWYSQTSTFKYTSGRLWSKKKFKYGYIEIRVKLPDPPSSPSTFQGIATNCWLFNAGTGNYWSEIDIYEINANNNWYTNNVHFQNTKNAPHLSNYYGHSSLSFNNQYKTFGVNWTQDKIEFYLDGEWVRTSTLKKQDSLIAMPIIIDMNIDANQFCERTDTVNTVFPYETEIDYIRVYQMKTLDCSTSKSYCNNISSHDYKMYKDITIDGGSCVDALNNKPNESYFATDYILFDQGFEAGNNLGAKFEVIRCFSGQDFSNSRVANPPLYEKTPESWFKRMLH